MFEGSFQPGFFEWGHSVLFLVDAELRRFEYTRELWADARLLSAFYFGKEEKDTKTDKRREGGRELYNRNRKG